MNKEARITIDTPVGKTKEIEVKSIVRQGTIYGPVLCSVSTDKVNKIGRKQEIKYGDVILEPMTYVDDILAAGDIEMVIGTIDNCRKLERMKKMTFNNQKSQYQILNFSTNKTPEEIKEKVKKGEIKRTHIYKYLGEIITENGSMEESIKGRMSKTNYITSVIKQYARKTGPLYIKIVNKLYLAIASPIILYNTETWTNVKKKEIQNLEVIQKDILYKLYKLPQSTPYYGVLSEMHIWTVEIQIKNKKLLLMHSLINSDDERIAKKVLSEQIKKEVSHCWYSELEVIADECEIDISIKNITTKTKAEWKKIVKIKCNKMMEKVMVINKGTKLRFTKKEWIKHEYINEIDGHNVIEILKMKMNMIEVKTNYKGKYGKEVKCPICEEEEDTTEHLFVCETTSEKLKIDNRRLKLMDIKESKPQELKELAMYAKIAMTLRQ
jgi:hypothetical protein